MQPNHIAKPELVDADEILNLCVTKDGINLILASGRTVDLELLSGSPRPAIGDYLLTGDGYTYVLAKAAFESRYMKLANLELDTRPGRFLPPPAVCAAAELIGRYFARENEGNWEIGQCRIRFPRGAQA